MIRSEFDEFLDTIYRRLGDPEWLGMAGEIQSGWDACFDGDGDPIDDLEILTRLKNVLDELHRELRRYESALDLTFEELESERGS